ncbi:Complex I intermediate-associated protein 30 (CIA30) [Rubritalea squalenifaciens DSM 18772]|uniref:Complex I intermediate-associated protein 30 (CIA30) n=1 Tax=Rubritalea squalenifaciens DSM 18772 TaxID=1123071 RepID=A0A1M6KYF0_9BACT|nr:CIA30 family protein [Rubritalea squalenifaciens]SHJ63970.1 Complex I intermediate-associated protein 30 (CIA30) [Rubritalea squalenifaciens DSM 18772]
MEKVWRKTTGVLAALVLGTVTSMAENIAEFSEKEVDAQGWRVVDDGVMGGLSQGKMEVSKDGVLRFSGTLSLENNGGFSSLRTGNIPLDLSAADGVVLRVKGDERTYQLRFNTDARFRGSAAVSFSAEFATVKGEWTEVRVSFEKFRGSFRGMRLDQEKFDPAKIERMGLLLADKKAGPFELFVDWVKTYKKSEKE